MSIDWSIVKSLPLNHFAGVILIAPEYAMFFVGYHDRQEKHWAKYILLIKIYWFIDNLMKNVETLSSGVYY